MTIKKITKNNKGFTLIEIIAVLIILGILAAVAIPKYLDLQEEAAKRGALGVVASAMSQLSLDYAEDVLNGDEFVLTGDASCNKVGISGEYNLGCGTGTLNTDITITVQHEDFDFTITNTWETPQGE